MHVTSRRHVGVRSTKVFSLVVTRMDTPNQGWTHYDLYTTEILLETSKNAN